MDRISEFEFRIFDLKNPLSPELFEDFYSIMEGSFPKEERRSRQGFLELISSCEKYRIFSLLEGGRLIAFFTIWDFSDFSFGDHFAVLESIRNKGIGAKLLEKVFSLSKLPFVLEAELPDTKIAEHRLNFYGRNGFKINEFPYLLPPMQEGCEAVPMRILSYPESLSESEFNSIKKTLYKEVYNVKTSAF